MLLVHFCPLSVYACFPHSTHMPCFTTTYSVAIVARRFTVSWPGSALLSQGQAPLTPVKDITKTLAYKSENCTT